MIRLTTEEAKSLGVEVGPSKKKSKYKAEPIYINNIRFASKKEGKRYLELVSLQAKGIISDLKLQVVFQFFSAGIEVDRWIVDFTYIDDCGRKVAEDPTGFLTAKKKRHIRYFEKQYPDWELIIS